MFVDQMVVIGECQVYYWQDFYFVIDCYWMVFNGMYIQNSVLWWVDDWCGYQGVEDVVVGNSEVIVGQVVYGQFVVVVFYCQFFDIFFDICYVQQVDVMQYWGDQIVWSGYGYVDVEVVVVYYVVVIDGSVYFWIVFQCFYYCFYVEGYKVQVDVMMFFECFIVLFMQIYDGFYVDFVKGCQYGGRVFCFQQMFGYVFMQMGYWDVFF